jgi:hypothetical protein
VRDPISLMCESCVFGERLDDAWAAFVLPSVSYQWLPSEVKRSHMSSLIAALEAIEADVQILRVGFEWNRRGYARGLTEQCGATHPQLVRRYAAEQERSLGNVGRARTRVFLLISLREPERDFGSYVSQAVQRHPRDGLRSLTRPLRMRERRVLSGEQWRHVCARAAQMHARIGESLAARPARSVELQWLVHRAFCRGLGEPQLDRLHEPRALLFERERQARLAPRRADVMRWTDGYEEERRSCLRVESELGESWQAQLVLGALPERAPFPGSRVELMFAPLESLPFAVDLSLNARVLPNELALRIARRRLQDADQIARAESDGEQGVSDIAYHRTQDARDLLSYLQATSRPALMRTTLAVAVGARNEAQLTERVESCRRAYGEVRLHRPLGDQLPLFAQHLPGQRTRVRGYDDTLTVEQVAAMMPIATHAAGSRRGFYLGYTLSGSRQPVRFNLSEGSERDRNSAILCVGALGSGKTTLTQKLQYEGFLQGARVVDCDPKGDHRFHLLDDVAPQAETIPLSAQPRLRGMLDPLRIAPEHLRRELAVAFLCDLLPIRSEAAWETVVLSAVDRVMRRCSTPTCLEVVRALREGEGTELEVGRALEIYARSGITQLGFADPQVRLPEVGERQVTYIPIRDLPTPEPGTARPDYSHSERVGQQIVRLIAMFATHLLARERDRLKLFAFDESWRLLADPVGRALLASLQRMGRSELAVPIMSTQLVTDGLVGERESLENLLGATFVFGMRSQAEAARALALIGVDPGDAEARSLLLGLDAGRCLMRDHRGRVEAVQVDVASAPLLRALRTTPRVRVGGVGGTPAGVKVHPACGVSAPA